MHTHPVITSFAKNCEEYKLTEGEREEKLSDRSEYLSLKQNILKCLWRLIKIQNVYIFNWI